MKKRLIRYVDKRGKNECWPWTGGKHEKGYGKLIQTLKSGTSETRIRKNWKAHRAYLVFVVGKKVPDDACVCHICDNPPCCNPRHLVIADRKWNTRDMVAKGRARFKTIKLTPKQVSTIKKSLKHHIISRPEVRDRFHITDKNLKKIVKGTSWKHILPLGPIDTLKGSSNVTPLARRLRASIRKHGMTATAKRLHWSVSKLRRLAYPLAPGHTYKSK